MLEDEVGRAATDQPETNRVSGVVTAGMPNRRIISEADANRTASGLGLKQVWDRNLVDREVVDLQLVLRVERDPRIVGESGPFQVEQAIATNRTLGVANLEAANMCWLQVAHSHHLPS